MAARPALMAHVPHLYLPGPWTASDLTLTDNQRHHLFKVLRMAVGDPVSYADGSGTTGRGSLGDGHVLRGEEQSVDRPSSVTVAVSPPASRHRCRYLVEKLAELAVERLVWIDTRHTEGRPPPGSKVAAWIEAALEQSRGAWIMGVDRGRIEDLDPERLVVADPSGDPPESVPIPSARAILLVGPEGGLDADEIPAQAWRMSLGPTVLRVETAAVVGAVFLAPPHGPSGGH